MHGQYGASAHSVIAGTYVFPAHFTVDVNERLVPPRLWTAHVAHVPGELIGIALTGPKFNPHRIVKRLINIIKPFVFIIPEDRDAILNELGCCHSGQLPPLGLILVCAMDQQ